ncbi:MAG: PrsW family intramembrane metalloprotease [Anaerolineae bacterium]|jgi:RsiW-degrading membrane proteinase PrsW (M82 family)|nr:PrsW family intramembrane metalloprotease [Anaerolineae bacterium]
MSLNTRLLTPPREEEEIYPYRRVWRSLIIENGTVAAAAVALFVAFGFLGLRLPTVALLPVNLLLAALPAALWLVFSWLPEARVPEPRAYLMRVFALSLLVASAFALPLIENVLRPETWLSLESAVNRIIGYTVTVGIVQETLKYLVLRYALPPEALRIRLDGVAYGAAIAVGFTTLFALDYVSRHPDAAPDAVIMRVLALLAMHLGGSLIMGYGVAETRLGEATLILLPVTLLVAAALHGVAIPLRSGLMNAQLSLDGGITRPLLALGFALVLLAAPQVVMSFFYRAAERRAEDVVRGQE